MKDFILQQFAGLNALDFSTVLLNNAVAVVFALFLMLTYRLTYAGTAYSRKYNVTLGMLVIITTLIMSVISSNVALSLGMVGALSIIRFRTAVKDMRDAGFIFWCIAIGVACGVSQYMLAGVSSVVIFVFMLVFRQIGPDSKMLLIVRADNAAQNRVEAIVEQHFGRSGKRIMKNASPQTCELVYQIGQFALKRSDERAKVDIVQRLVKVEGVQSVNMVEQSDDISR